MLSGISSNGKYRTYISLNSVKGEESSFKNWCEMGSNIMQKRNDVRALSTFDLSQRINFAFSEETNFMNLALLNWSERF